MGHGARGLYLAVVRAVTVCEHGCLHSAGGRESGCVREGAFLGSTIRLPSATLRGPRLRRMGCANLGLYHGVKIDLQARVTLYYANEPAVLSQLPDPPSMGFLHSRTTPSHQLRDSASMGFLRSRTAPKKPTQPAPPSSRSRMMRS